MMQIRYLLKQQNLSQITNVKLRIEIYKYYFLRNLRLKIPSNFNPTVRIHSQCVTGDIFHSLKCDCGEQLNKSLDIMVKNEEGILIYLPQEGRDIGLTNK